MLKNAKKYLIVSLSFLLILSNFSFVVTYSLCNMGSMKESCSSTHRTNQEHFSGLTISNSKKTCCEEKISELSNSNILLIDQSSDYNFTAGNVDYIIDNLSIFDNVTIINTHFTFPDKIPKEGIPITISSLLI